MTLLKLYEKRSQALAAVDRAQNVLCLIEAQASQLRDEQKLAKLVSLLFKKQGSGVITAFKRRYNLTEDTNDFIDKGLASGNDLMPAIENLVKATYIASALGLLRKHKVDFQFDLKNPRAIAYFKSYGVDLLKELNGTTKASIKAMIEQGLENGHSYDRIARAIKAKFESYAELPKRGPSHIRSRAQLVAITELGNAYQQGNIDGVRAAMSTGLKFEKKWLTVGDKRVSAGCKENQAAGWIDIDKEFPSGSDRPLRFPGCRCSALYRRISQ